MISRAFYIHRNNCPLNELSLSLRSVTKSVAKNLYQSRSRGTIRGRFDDTYVTKHALLSIILSVALIFCHFFFSREKEKRRTPRLFPPSPFEILAPRTDVFRTVSARVSLKPVHKKFASLGREISDSRGCPRLTEGREGRGGNLSLGF